MFVKSAIQKLSILVVGAVLATSLASCRGRKVHVPRKGPADSTPTASVHHASPPMAGLSGEDSSLSARAASSPAEISRAFATRTTLRQILVRAAVRKVLPDDIQGDRHQRFLVALADGRTLLVAHNIDLAARVPDLRPNTTIYLQGEFVWSAAGGVLHWTHKDPRGRHLDGWIQYFGKRYQ